MPKNIQCDANGNVIFLKVIYKTKWATEFEIDRELTRRTLEIEGRKEYVLEWIREKLRKMENGQIKVVKCFSPEKGKRDWEEEEKIKKQLWEDINVNEYPKGIDFDDGVINQIIHHKEYKNVCSWPDIAHEQQVEYKRPPSPCRIS